VLVVVVDVDSEVVVDVIDVVVELDGIVLVIVELLLVTAEHHAEITPGTVVLLQYNGIFLMQLVKQAPLLHDGISKETLGIGLLPAPVEQTHEQVLTVFATGIYITATSPTRRRECLYNILNLFQYIESNLRMTYRRSEIYIYI
jgi:hypothetical protein